MAAVATTLSWVLGPGCVLAQEVGLDTTEADGSWINNFAFERSESLINEGRQLMAEHHYAEAELVYDQAWQITRINHGLHDPGQIKAVEHLLDALLAQSKWDEFDQQLSYLIWLNETANQDDVASRVAGLTLISNWYRAAAATLSDQRSNWYLIHAKHLNWQAISLLESHFGTQDLQLAPLLYRVAMDHYYQAVSTQRRGMTSFEYKTDAKTPVNGWSLTRNETVNSSYRIGRESLLRIRSLYSHSAKASPLVDGLLLVHLADWELVFEHGVTATAYYGQAYKQLMEAGIDKEDVERFFNRPAVLPETHLRVQWPLWESDWEKQPLEYVAWSPAYPGAQKPDDPLDTFKSRLETLRSQRATIHLDPGTDSHEVVEQEYDPGRFNYVVSDLDVVENPEIKDSVLSWVYAELPMLKLRPRIQNGQLTIHEAFTLDYIFSGTR